MNGLDDHCGPLVKARFDVNLRHVRKRHAVKYAAVLTFENRAKAHDGIERVHSQKIHVASNDKEVIPCRNALPF